MLIKNATLSLHLTKRLPAIYCLIGQDPFQIDIFAKTIIAAWKQDQCAVERLIFDLSAGSDWDSLAQEANNYSLFSEKRLFDARIEKKTLDSAAKKFLDAYLKNPPADCLLMLRAPQLSIKVLQDYASSDSFFILSAQTPAKSVIIKWIAEALKKQHFSFEEEIPACIFQFNEGNLLAISQVIEKFKLIFNPGDKLDLITVQSQLSVQCDFVLFDLPKICFENNPIKAIQLLRQAQNQKQDPTLILWILTQALRVLIRMQDIIQNGQSIADAAKKLKLWSNQITLYQMAVKRYDLVLLKNLLYLSDKLDKQLKTTSMDIYQSLERIALSLCKGSPL